MDHDIDYRLRMEFSTELISFHQALIAQADLCNCLETLDDILVAEFGNRSIGIKYKTPTGCLADVGLCLSSEQPLSQEAYDAVLTYLAAGRRMVLNTLHRMNTPTAFADLHKLLIRLENNITDKIFVQLNPTSSLAKKSLAKVIVHMSQITIGRRTSQNLIYEDRDGEIVFSCEFLINMDDLLGPVRTDDTIYEGVFQIKRAPGNRNTPFELMIDSRKVKHSITDASFWKEWENGEHQFVCYATMRAKFQIEKTHDFDLFKIVKVVAIDPPHPQRIQQSFDEVDYDFTPLTEPIGR